MSFVQGALKKLKDLSAQLSSGVQQAYNSNIRPLQYVPQAIKQDLPNIGNRLINNSPILPKIDFQPLIQRGIDRNQTGVMRKINTGINSVVSPMINAPLNLPRTTVTLGKNILGYGLKAASGTGYRTQDVLSDVLSPAIDLGINAYGLKTAPKAVVDVAKNAAKNTFKKSLISGAKVGGAYGFAQGFADSLPNNRVANSPEQQIVRSGFQAIPSGVAGATIGGLMSGGAYGAGKLFNGLKLVYKSKFPKATDKEVTQATKQFIRDEADRFAGKPIKKEFEYYGDMRERLGLSRTGDVPMGLSIRPLSEAEHNASIKPQSTVGGNAQSTLSDTPKYNTPMDFLNSPEYASKMKELKAMKMGAKPTPKSNNLYHTTPVENLDSIMKNGLTTGNKPRYEGVSGSNNISFSANEAGASYYGGPNDVMIRTKTSYKPKDLSLDLLGGGEGNYITNTNIPPEALEVKINGKWKPLSQLPSPQSTLQPPTIKIKPSEKVTKSIETPQLSKQPGISQPSTTSVLPRPLEQTKPPSVPQTGQTIRISKSLDQPSEKIIAEAKNQIGKPSEQVKKSFKEEVSNLYTQWVDRYNPIVKASRQAKNTLKIKGAELRPENDPEYLVRRLTGAGGIADAKFRTELEPIVKQLDQLKIDKSDLDVYLANKRIAGFGKANREVYGADPKKANQVISALEQKYGQSIKGIADQLYAYQNKGFQEMVDAGFISPENAKIIQQQNPDYSPLYRVMDDVSDYLGLPTRKTMQGSQPILKIKGSTKKIESPLESIIGNTFSQRAAIEKNRVAKSIVGLQNIADLGFTKAAKSSDDTITIWKNGQKEYWNVGKDIAEVAKGTNEEAMNLVLKIIQAPASLLRQGATGRNPEFMLPNIIRDQLDAGVSSKYGYIPFIDYISGLKSMLKNDDVYKAWERSGAKIDLGEMSGKKSISAYFDQTKAKKGLFSWLSSALDVMGKYSEQPTRVGLFKKAYKATGNDLIAAMESRDATVDFARMGSKMKVANSIIPFLNVGVQGFDKLIRSVKNNPAKVLFNAALYGAAPAAAATLYNLTNHPEEYAEIPQYEKDSNFVLVKGRNESGTVDYVSIPKGNIIPTIANPIQSFLEFAGGQSQQSLQEMATSLISGTLPVVGDGQSLQEVALKTVGSNIPQAIKPVAENLLNKSFYKYDPKKEQTKDIVPYYLQNRPKYKQDYAFTPQMYKKIGAVLNESPLKVQNIMEGYLAGYSKIPAQVIEMMTKTSRGQEISPNEKTLLRRFIKQTYPGSAAKPTAQPTRSPGLMERVTGKANASSQMSPDQEKYAIEDEKYRMKNSKLATSKVGNKYLITKDNGDIETIDITSEIKQPKTYGDAEINKKLLSQYKSKLTSRQTDIAKLLDAGMISEEEAVKLWKQVEALKTKSGTGKKGKKLKFSTAKISPPKFKAYQPKKASVQFSMPKISAPPNPKTLTIPKGSAILKSAQMTVKPIRVRMTKVKHG